MLPTLTVDKSYPYTGRVGGFDASNVARNTALEALGEGGERRLPQARKTGTTIVGVVFKGGVVLGADTRATGDVVVDKNCAKLHYIAPNIYCAGAGTAADCVQTTALVSARLELLRLNSNAPRAKVAAAMTMAKRHLHQYGGEIESALIMGGVDETGGHVYSIYPHGSTDKLPFATMGSGSLAAMSVLETQYRDDLGEDEAKELVANAIRAGIFNDLGSGSNVDLCVMRLNSTSYLRNYQRPNDVAEVRRNIALPAPAFAFPVGTTPFKKERVEVFARPASATATTTTMEVEPA